MKLYTVAVYDRYMMLTHTLKRNSRTERSFKSMSAINKPIDGATYCKIRSAYKISTITQCVNELVFNALSAGSTSIAVRLNFSKFRVQVVDNGRGITEQLMCDVGEKKLPCTDPSSRSVLGENVFFIVQLAEKVNIQSKSQNGQTYRKKFSNGKVKQRHMQDKIVRSCHGTTITVKNMLHRFPVRQKYATKIQEITSLIDRISSLSILFPNVSFSLRDDEDYTILLRTSHTVGTLSAFRTLFGAVYPHDFCSTGYVGTPMKLPVPKRLTPAGARYHGTDAGAWDIRNFNLSFVFWSTLLEVFVELKSENVQFENFLENLASDNLRGQLFLGVCSHNDKALQFVSINDRPLYKNSRLHQYVEEFCSKHVGRSSSGRGHAVFILKLSCDKNRVEIVDNASESFVHFSISTSIIEFMKHLVEKCFGKDPITRKAASVNGDAELSAPDLSKDFHKTEEIKLDGFTLPEEITECMPEDEKISLIDTEREKNLARKEDFGNIVGKEAGIFEGFFNFEDDHGHQEEEGCNVNILGVWNSSPRISNSNTDSCFPTLIRNHNAPKMSDAIKLTKDQVDGLKIINQIDNKFIVCDKVDEKNSKLKHLILAFDQHAVSERIRLEHLTKDYIKDRAQSFDVKSAIVIPMKPIDILFVKNNIDLFKSFALEFDFQRLSSYGDKIFVQKVPVMFRDNTSPEHCETFDLCRDVFKLISQIIETSKEIKTTTMPVGWIPDVIRQRLITCACRGAVKFGDHLTFSECENLIGQLKFCRQPFECAHGRPTVVPLVELTI